MDTKKMYESPVVEVMEAHVEKGFMGSNTDTPTEPTGTQRLTDGETYYFN